MPRGAHEMVLATVKVNGPRGKVRLRRNCWVLLLWWGRVSLTLSPKLPISTCPNWTHSSRPYLSCPPCEALGEPPTWSQSLLTLHCFAIIRAIIVVWSTDQWIDWLVHSFNVFVTHSISAIRHIREEADE